MKLDGKKKFIVALLGKAIGVYLITQGQVDLGVQLILGNTAAFMIGQGVADFGKGKAQVEKGEG